MVKVYKNRIFGAGLLFLACAALLAGCAGKSAEPQEKKKEGSATPAAAQAVSGELENPAADGEVVDYEKEKLVALGKYKKIPLSAEDLKDKDYTKEEMAAEQAWEIVIENCEVSEYPEELVKEEFDDQVVRYKDMADLLGSTYEDLLAEFGMDEETLHEVAQYQVKERMVAKTIAARESLELTDDVYKKYLKITMAEDEEYKKEEDLEKLTEAYRSDYSARPKDDMIIAVVKDYVGGQADIEK